MHKIIIVFFNLFILITNLYAKTNTSVYEVPEISAVENKMFNPQKDLSLKLGFLPLDAFYKAVTLGVSYTNYYESYWAWEIINVDVAFSQNTGLKEDLINNFSVEPKGILEFPKYYISSNLIYTPIYSKNLLFNQNVVRSEISFVGGGGMIVFNSNDKAPMLGGGLVLRFFKDHSISYKFDSRLYYHTAQEKSSNFLLNIALAVSWEFGEVENNNEIK